MQRFSKSEELLGTVVEIVIYAQSASIAGALFDVAFNECGRIEKSYSRFRSDNELAELNGAVGKKVKISDEMRFLLKFGDEMWLRTKGFFDMRVKKVLENLGYDLEYSFVNKGEDKLDFGVLSEGSGIEFFEENFVRISQEVEFGAFGKGYALDRVKTKLAEVENFCINAGGDLYAKGKDLEIGAWKTVFENPMDVTEAIGIVEVDDVFLASSSANRRRWADAHHLIDPQKAEAASEMLAVYVQAKEGMVADAFSTAFYVMGFEKAKKLLRELRGNVEAMLIVANGEMYLSEGFKGEIFLRK